MLLVVLVALAAVGTVLLCMVKDPGGIQVVPVCIGEFAALLIGVCLCYILILFVISLFIGKREPEPDDHPFIRKILILTVEAMCQVAGVRLHIEGAELLPEGRFLLVSNHRSNFDPIITLAAFPGRKLAFISKIGNLKIPIVGSFLRYCNFLSIDRENPRNAIRTINAAADLIVRDVVSMGVYPEGRRNPTDVMLPFHDGVMMVAQKAHVPVAVMTIDNAERVAKRFPFRSTDVTIRLRGVLPAEQVEASRTGELSAAARALMES